MKVCVVGVGHVGLVTAAALARWGHDVVGVDHDEARIRSLQAGSVPFHEPGLDALIEEGVTAGALRFTSSSAEGMHDAEVVFCCVGTPAREDGRPNLSYIEGVGADAAALAPAGCVLVEKSTVPARTGERLRRVIALERGIDDIHVASNPEFLREGSAVEDTLRPDRLVYGTDSDFARDQLRRVYDPLVRAEGTPVVETDVPTAELIKHASNAFLATKISFINAVAEISERVGADVQVVADGMGLDARIGRSFLNAGLGYGGSCFPKDVDAFTHLAAELGVPFRLLEEVGAINTGQRRRALDKLRSELWHLEGKTIAILGAAFKPGTDDLRESPALHLASELQREGAHVRIYDPVALDAVAREFPEAERFSDPLDACRGAHAAIICTQWPEIAALDPEAFVDALAYPVLIDGRNVFEPERMSAAGLRYHSFGRPRKTSGGRPVD